MSAGPHRATREIHARLIAAVGEWQLVKVSRTRYGARDLLYALESLGGSFRARPAKVGDYEFLILAVCDER